MILHPTAGHVRPARYLAVRGGLERLLTLADNPLVLLLVAAAVMVGWSAFPNTPPSFAIALTVAAPLVVHFVVMGALTHALKRAGRVVHPIAITTLLGEDADDDPVDDLLRRRPAPLDMAELADLALDAERVFHGGAPYPPLAVNDLSARVDRLYEHLT